MGAASAGPDRVGAAGTRRRWRLTGAPPPSRSERLSRVVGLRVLRIPGLRRVLVVAGSVDRLRDLATRPDAVRPTSRATIVVVWWRRPRKGWPASVGRIDHLVRHRVALPRIGRGMATVRLRLARPARFRDVVRAALSALDGSRPMPAPASASVTSHGLPPAYLPAGPAVGVAPGDLPDNPDIRPHDVVLSRVGAEPVADPLWAVRYPTGRHGPHVPDGTRVVLVDAERINPRGRRAAAYQPDAPRLRLEFGPAGRRWRWSAGAPGCPLDGPGLDAATLATLRQVAVVECPLVFDTEPVETAALLVQLAMTGVVVHTPTLPAGIADLISPELRGLLPVPPPAGDSLALEARSVRQRRAAIRGHATGFALPRLVANALPGLARPPSVSVVLATRRPELLAGVLGAMIGQTYPELEIILCLHGVELPDQVRIMLSESGRPFEIVHAPSTTGFGEVLGIATRRARGTLITKVDDDDTYSVEHVWDLVLARHYSGATLVGKGTEFVYLETLDTTVRRPSGVPEATGELVAGGTMLLAKGDLEAVGGWRPVPRSVDLGLIDRLRRDGAVIYRTHPLGYIYHRRATGHTWDPGQQYFLDTAFARWPGIPADAIGDLDQPQFATSPHPA